MDDKNTTVSKAVYAVNYVNVSHFSQAFRKFYGRSPRRENIER
ncbi:MAG: AraC family transcriptional regulator [Treponema sp.]